MKRMILILLAAMIQSVLFAGEEPGKVHRHVSHEQLQRLHFFKAARENKVVVLQQLLELNGQLINERTIQSGYTALHYAAEHGSIKVLNFLLSWGIDTDVRNMGFETPLHLAARRGQAKAVRALLDAGAQVNVRSCEGHTPLFEAVNRCNTFYTHTDESSEQAMKDTVTALLHVPGIVVDDAAVIEAQALVAPLLEDYRMRMGKTAIQSDATTCSHESRREFDDASPIHRKHGRSQECCVTTPPIEQEWFLQISPYLPPVEVPMMHLVLQIPYLEGALPLASSASDIMLGQDWSSNSDAL